MLSRALSAHLTRDGTQIHDRLQKLLCTPKMVKHGFGLFRYLDSVIENCLMRGWRLMKEYIKVRVRVNVDLTRTLARTLMVAVESSDSVTSA